MYKLLIADDEKWISNGIIARIKKAGFDFLQMYKASDGDEALQVIQAERPHIVLADIKMPCRNGIELLNEAMHFDPDIKFIMISGYSDFEYAQQAMNLGAKAYILKPVADENLRDALNKVISQLDEEVTYKRLKVENTELKSFNERYLNEKAINKFFSSYNKDSMPDFMDYGEKDNKYLLMLLNITRASRSGDIMTAKLQVTEFLDGLDKETYRLRIFDNLNNARQIFVIMSHEDENTLNKLAGDLIKETAEGLKAQQNYSIIFALSSIGDRITGEAYRQVKEAFNLRLVLDESNVYRYQNRHIADSRLLLQSKDLELLAKYIEAGNTERVESALKSIFSKQALKNITGKQLKILYYQCINVFMNICFKKSIDIDKLVKDELLTGDIIDYCNNTDEIVENLVSLVKLVTAHSNNGFADSRDVVEKVKQYIDNEYKDDLKLDTLACKFLINPTYLSNIFSREVGQTITQYIYQTRMKKACELLKETTLSVEDISYIVGYNDTQYFHRIFKKYHELTPVQYRNAYFENKKRR